MATEFSIFALEGQVDDLRSELATAQLAHATEVTRREAAEGWRDAFRQALADLLAIFPDGYTSAEEQMVLMRCHDLASGGERQFKQRGSK